MVMQVGRPDLVRSAGHDLLGGEDAILDEAADYMVGDAERLAAHIVSHSPFFSATRRAVHDFPCPV